MPTNRWIGIAQPVRAVRYFVPRNVSAGVEFVLTNGASVASYKYPKLRPLSDDIPRERAQRVVDELISILQSNSLSGGDPVLGDLEWEADEYEGVPALKCTGGDKGQPISVTSSATNPTANSVRVVRVQEGLAAVSALINIRWPSTPTGGTWWIAGRNTQAKEIAFDAAASVGITSLENILNSMGLPCASVSVTGSHIAGYDITLTGLTEDLEYPPFTFPRITASSLVDGVTGVAGYRAQDLTDSSGVLNQQNWLPLLDGNLDTFYRFEWDGLYSSYFTGASTIEQVADAARSLWGANGVTVSPSDNPNYFGIIEFSGDFTERAVDAQLESGGSLEQLEVKREFGPRQFGFKMKFTFTQVIERGTFTISDGVLTTAAIAWSRDMPTLDANISGAMLTAGMAYYAVDVAMEANDSTTTGQVSVTITTLEATSTIRWTMNLANLVVSAPIMEVKRSGTRATPDIQAVVLENGPDGGTFTLTYNGQTTGNIAYNASPTTVQTALEALSNIDPGDIVVRGADGGPWQIRFTANGVRPIMTANGANLTITNAPTFNGVTVATGTGPHHFSNTANWSLGSVPVDGDDIVFSDGDVGCLFDLAQSAITPLSITVYRSFTGNIGLPETRLDGSRETLSRYLALGNSGDAGTQTLVTIGDGDESSGDGPDVVRLNLGTRKMIAFVRHAKTATENRVVALIGTNTANEVYVNARQGDVALGVYPEDVGTLARLHVVPGPSASGLQVSTGESMTITALVQDGGVVDVAKPPSTAQILGGEAIVRGTGVVNSLEVESAQVVWLVEGNVGRQGSVSGVAISSGVATLTSNAHGLSSGDRVYVRGESGILGLDSRSNAVRVVNANSFELVGSNCSGAYSGSGMSWGLERAVIVGEGGVLDLERDARVRDLVAPVVVKGDGQVLDYRGNVTDLRIWPEQVPAYASLGRSIEIRRRIR